jgi:hypothetical protein
VVCDIVVDFTGLSGGLKAAVIILPIMIVVLLGALAFGYYRYKQ